MGRVRAGLAAAGHHLRAARAQLQKLLLLQARLPAEWAALKWLWVQSCKMQPLNVVTTGVAAGQAAVLGLPAGTVGPGVQVQLQASTAGLAAVLPPLQQLGRLQPLALAALLTQGRAGARGAAAGSAAGEQSPLLAARARPL